MDDDVEMRVRGCGFLTLRALTGVVLGGVIGVLACLVAETPIRIGWWLGAGVGLCITGPVPVFGWAHNPYRREDEDEND